MAQANFAMPPVGGGPARKPKTNIYTLLLVIALVALLTGCLFLYLEIRRFGGFGAIHGSFSALSAPADVQLAQAHSGIRQVAG
jgi:hypothetical protein